MNKGVAGAGRPAMKSKTSVMYSSVTCNYGVRLKSSSNNCQSLAECHGAMMTWRFIAVCMDIFWQHSSKPEDKPMVR